jgi:hypothetical protein
MLCCVYTRFVYEVPYIDSFIEHYLRLGFDKIFILYHDIIDYDVPEQLLEEVELIKVENNGNKLLNEYKHLFQDDDENSYDWVLNVDSDEFLLLDSKYESIKQYINAKLCEESEINIFQFSWGWLHAFNPPSNYTLNDFLNNYKIFVGSKDTSAPDIWVKSMSKVKDIEYMTCHNCVLKRNNEAVIHVNGDVLRKITDENIDEEEDEDDDDINLLPRSYCYDDLNTYTDAILIHINTRNMMNAIIKGLNIHVTQVKRKRIKKFKQLKKFVNGFDFSQPLYKETLNEFTNCIGYKMKFPLLCLEKEEIHEKIRHLKLGTTTTTTPLCREAYIPEQNRHHLDNLQERMNSIFHMLDLEKFVKILSLFATILDNTFKRTTSVS